MITYKVTSHKNKSVITVENNGETIRKVDLIIGKEYRVNPIKTTKQKHRGRDVVLNKISNDGFKGCRAYVKFIDNMRPGKVDIEDLDYIK
jgi:hypothetical protein